MLERNMQTCAKTHIDKRTLATTKKHHIEINITNILTLNQNSTQDIKDSPTLANLTKHKVIKPMNS